MNPVLANLMAIGLHVKGLSDEEATAFLHATEDEPQSTGMFVHMFAENWARCGFPRVVLGHRHGAALMATHTSPEALVDVRAPWDAFAIDVPADLVEWSSEAVPSGLKRIEHVFVIVAPDGLLIMLYGDRHAVWEMAACPSLRDAGGAFVGAGEAEEVLARLTVGVCLEMTEHRASQAVALGPLPVRRSRRGEPETNTFRLTRDVQVDVREAVRAYVRGRGQSPRVQSLVRGHWKRQPCGESASQRAWIFVEPYWRGPEAAPIALRPHRPKPRTD